MVKKNKKDLKDLKNLKIKNFKEFKNLKKRQIFPAWDKEKHVPILDKNIPTKELIKGLRYIHGDFDKYDLRKFKDNPQTRKKVSRILNEYYSLTKSRGKVKEHTPRKNNRKIISDLSQQKGNWKKYYIPVNSEKDKISYKTIKGKKFAIEKTKVATYINLYFNKLNLAKNSDKEVDRLLKGMRKIKHIRIINGEYLVGAKFEDKKQVKLRIKRLMANYNNTSEWLDGLKVLQKFNKKKRKAKKKK